MRLAIADPPYPPMLKAIGGYKPRATRWYGAEARGNNRQAADFHESSAEWNDPRRHRQLLDELMSFDGWALATSPDSLEIYSPLPLGTRIGAWVKPNGMPGSHRLRSVWEPIVVYVPAGRRRNVGRGAIPDVVTANAPRNGFPGEKPKEWVQWVLSALSYSPSEDTIVDMFPGSGAVTRVVEEWAA